MRQNLHLWWFLLKILNFPCFIMKIVRIITEIFFQRVRFFSIFFRNYYCFDKVNEILHKHSFDFLTIFSQFTVANYFLNSVCKKFKGKYMYRTIIKISQRLPFFGISSTNFFFHFAHKVHRHFCVYKHFL